MIKKGNPTLHATVNLLFHLNGLLWGVRVVISSSLRGRLLDELRLGVVKMKTLTRSHALVARDRLSHVPDFKKQALPAALFC